MLDNTESKQEKEIPSQLAVLDKDLEIQNAIISALRQALAPVSSSDQPSTEDTGKSPPSLTELGGRLRAYGERLTSNTQELRQLLDSLEL
jgi:hypothetical protein